MEKSRTINSIKNIITSLSYQIITVFLGFISRSVFLYCLSVDYLGVQGLFSDILNMLSLTDLGFGTAMIYSLYQPLANNDKEKIAGLINFYKKVYRTLAIFLTAMGLSLVPFLKYLVNLDNELPHIKIYYILYLANMVASYLVVYKTNILEADQKTYIIQKYNIIFTILQNICMIIFLLLTRNYIIYLCTQVFFTYIKNLYISHIAERQYPFIKNKVNLSKNEERKIFKNVGSAFLYKISGVLINATDNTLISILVSTSTVGYYSNYSLIITKITGFINTFFYSITASLGNLVVTESKDKRFETFQTMQTVSNILSTFCIVCVLILTQDFIGIWLGKEYQLENQVLYAIVINFYFSISLLPIWIYRDATGLYRKTRFVMLLCAILNIIYSIILGKLIGLSGIIIATSLSRLSTYFWYEPRLLFKTYFGKSCLVYFKQLFRSVLITFLTIWITYFLCSKIIVVDIISLIIKGGCTAAITLGIILLIYRKDEGFLLIVNRFKMLIGQG